jgi:GT2 family glycosyltransferase/glycosyltransferase involved in cell wall biosynthesis
MSGVQRPAGHVEIIEQGEGLTLLGGWARIPPELPPGGAVLRFTPEGQDPVERPLRVTLPRADLPPTAELPGARSFQIVLRHLPAWRAGRAELLLDGTALPMGPEVLRPRPFRPRGHLGAANRNGVSGWVLGLPGQPPMLTVEGLPPVPVPLDLHRADLPFDDGGEPPRFGFRLTPDALGDLLRAADPALALMDGRARGVTLTVGEVELGHEVFQLRRVLEGKLEQTSLGELRGWAKEAEPGANQPAVDLLLDGTRWMSLPATTFRADLAANGVGTKVAGGAIAAPLPLAHPGEGPTVAVALRPKHGEAELPGAVDIALPPWRPERAALLDLLPPDGPGRIAIIVPIHNAAEDLERCVEAVLRHATGPARLILIDDASTDPAVGRLLDGWRDLPGVEVHANERNLGFTGTVNLGLALAGRDDVVLLNSDTMVGPGWLDGLRLAACATARVGTVTAVSNNAGAFSVPEFDTENHPPAWFGTGDLARLARQAALGLWPEVPTGNGFCMLIRRACLDAVGPFDAEAFPRGYGEENDFCLRALRAGFENLVDDRTLVWHRRSASFGETRHAHIAAGREVLAERYPEYRTLTGGFRDDQAFLAIRWRLRRALEAARRSGELPRPRLLFVISTTSGGTPQTNRDLMAALADRYEPWVLRCDGKMLELTRHGEDAPAEQHRLLSPLKPGTHRSGEYDRLVAGILLRHGFELVHIRHIAWHGLGLPEVCRRLGIPVVFSFHDFYAVCPTIKLLDAQGRYCAGRCTTGEGDCVPELWPPGAMPPLRGRFVHRWREMMAEALAACDAFVTTSPYAKTLLEEHFPALATGDFRLIPHGRSFPRMSALAAEPTLEEPLRVLVPGNISAAKGGALIAAIAALDTERDVEFHILGGVDSTLADAPPGVVLHGRYERDAFADHVRAISPHLGAVLSLWPETYCHTLTECWAAGLPVLGTEIGAVGERIGADGGGWLISPDAEPEAVLALLQGLKRDVAAIRARRDAVLDWQRRIGRHYDTPAMAAAYDRLYREVMDRRRSFAGARPVPRPPVVLAVSPRDGAVPFRLPLPIANRLERAVIYRPGTASHPFGDAAAGEVDAILLGAGTLRPRDAREVLDRCARAGLRVVLEADEPLAEVVAAGRAASPIAPGWTLLAATPRAAAILADAGLDAVPFTRPAEPRDWLAASTGAVPFPTRRVLVFADDPGLPALQPALADLLALDVAEVVTLGQAASPLEGAATFRAQTHPGGLLLLPEAPGESGPQAERALIGAAAGLVVLRGVAPGEVPGEAAGLLLLPEDPAAWIRAIAELGVDATRCARLAREARRHAQARIAAAGGGRAFDRLWQTIGAGAPILDGASDVA